MQILNDKIATLHRKLDSQLHSQLVNVSCEVQTLTYFYESVTNRFVIGLDNPLKWELYNLLERQLRLDLNGRSI